MCIVRHVVSRSENTCRTFGCLARLTCWVLPFIQIALYLFVAVLWQSGIGGYTVPINGAVSTCVEQRPGPEMMKRLLVFCLLLSTAHGFVLSPPRASSSKGLKLTPDQAPDLEACACDIMKAAVLAKAAQDIQQQQAVPFMAYEQPSNNKKHVLPVWCRRIWPFSHGHWDTVMIIN